jgi:hypothetical protein
MESRLQAEQRAGDSLRAQLTQAHTDADQQRLDAVGKDGSSQFLKFWSIFFFSIHILLFFFFFSLPRSCIA